MARSRVALPLGYSRYATFSAPCPATKWPPSMDIRIVLTGPGMIPPSADGPWPAPAKLNLCLHINGRRADGYHELQTVFQFLDCWDELYFEVHAAGPVRRAMGPGSVPEDQDLCVRAAKLLRDVAGVGRGVTIYLDKRLPVGGGLGAGSSDAATTLVSLNRLWGLDMEIAELAGIGRRLGADVPVFIRGRAAWGEGRGDELSPISLPEPWYLILVPPVSVSTAEVFSAPELTRDAPRIKIADFLSGAGRNDCEPVVRRRYPQVAEALDWLGRHALARLTGTGCCVFAAFDMRKEADRIAESLPDGWKGFVARGRNRSPLLVKIGPDTG